MPHEKQPLWFTLGEELMWPLVGMAASSCRAHKLSTPDLQALGELAIWHHAGCLETSIHANKRGKHSAALCLIRQSIEAISIAELALQPPEFAEPLLIAWKEEKKTHGEIRKALEREVWPQYGSGLWKEPWADFYGNLARAVQDYAHYSPKLQGWQFATLSHDGGKHAVVTFGLQTYDALLATRITLLQGLLSWMLGRVLMAHGKNPDVMERQKDIVRLGNELGESKLLFRGGDWGSQLAPMMLFKPGHDWRSDT